MVDDLIKQGCDILDDLATTLDAQEIAKLRALIDIIFEVAKGVK